MRLSRKKETHILSIPISSPTRETRELARQLYDDFDLIRDFKNFDDYVVTAQGKYKPISWSSLKNI